MDEGTQFASVLARIGRDVLKQLEGLSDELLNRPLALPETNTLFALATHIAGSTEFWVLEMAGGRRVDRIRQAEFRSAGRREDLIVRYERWLGAIHGVLRDLPRSAMDRATESPAEYRSTGGLGERQLSVRECLLHAVEHAALHLGHIQITRQIILADELPRK